MVQLAINSGKGQHGVAEMFIDYQSRSIGFTVIHEKKQFDFTLEPHEWNQVVKFIELAMSNDVKTSNS